MSNRKFGLVVIVLLLISFFTTPAYGLIRERNVDEGVLKQAYTFASPDILLSTEGTWEDVPIAGQPDTGAGQQTVYYVMPYAGHVLGITAYSNAAITTAGISFDVTINDTRTGLRAVLDTTNTQTKATTQKAELDVFEAGDKLGVDCNMPSSFAPSGSADFTIVVIVGEKRVQ